MASLLVKVKAKMAIYAHERVRGMLEGEYGSVFKGRSMDFDDLREYTPGDDIKDIDWKATARAGSTLIKRYVAIRKHNILLVVDTGRNMAATGQAGEVKCDTTVMAAGVLSYIALKHGDLVGMVAGDSTSSKHLPFKGGSTHVEQILQHIHSTTRIDGQPGRIATQLEYIVRNMRRRMMIVVLTDDSEFTPEYNQLLRRIRAQHEVLWVMVGDSSGLGEADEYYDIEGVSALPHFLRRNKAVQQDFATQQEAYEAWYQDSLERLGIMGQRITSESEVVPGLFRLLERQRHAR